MKIIVLISLLFCSCANVYSTRLTFESETSKLIVDMPKELETKNLKVSYDSQQGKIEITADSWISANQGTIRETAGREKAILEGSATLIEKSVEGAVRGMMKGIKPTP